MMKALIIRSAYRLIFALILSGAISGHAVCEEAETTQAATPNAEPQTPLVTEAVSGEAKNVEEKNLVLNFKSAPLEAVLDFLSEKAGLIIMSETEISGRISLKSLQPVSVSETVSLLNTVLKEKGYTAVRQGRVLRIVTLEQSKKENLPVESGNDPDKVEDGDDVITQIIPLSYVDVTKLKDDISSLIPSYAQLSSNESSNSLIMTGTRSSIKRILKIVRGLDTAVAGVSEIKVFPLEYADAEDTADLLTEIFESDTSNTNSRNNNSPMSRFFRMRGGPPGSQNQNSSDSSAKELKFKASSDERTNSVVVSAAPEIMKVVEKVINDLDANPTGDQEVMVYKLKNADADNLQEVLNNLFEDSDSSNDTSNVRGSFRGFPGGNNNNNNSNSSSDGTGNDLRGEVDVVADTDTNTLLVMTATRNFERVRKIIDELDSPVQQVLIKVLLAEVTLDDESDMGVEFSVLNLEANSDGNQIFSDFGIADATGGFNYRLVNGDLNVALNALKTVGKTNVLSRPYILTSDNNEASITVGQEVPYITDTSTTDAGKTINTIEYEDIGIILTVTPHVNPDGLVILDVNPEISSISDATVEISDNLNATVFSKRYSESRVSVMDGKTIVIGGLMQNDESKTESKVPLLGDIPVLGKLFKHTNKNNEKKELLIFLTPHVVKDGTGFDYVTRKEKVTLSQPEKVKAGQKDQMQEMLDRMGVDLDLEEETADTEKKEN